MRNLEIVPAFGGSRIMEDGVCIATFANLDDAVLFLSAARKGS